MICAHSTLAWRRQDGALWIDRNGVYSWMRLRPRDTLQRERQNQVVVTYGLQIAKSKVAQHIHLQMTQTCNLQRARVKESKSGISHLKLSVVLVPAYRWRWVAGGEARQQCQAVHR